MPVKGKKRAERLDDTVSVDKFGFLLDFEQWNEKWVKRIAKEVRAKQLTEKHWQAIHFTRQFYQDYERAPEPSEVAKAVGIALKNFIDYFPCRLNALIQLAGLPRFTIHIC